MWVPHVSVHVISLSSLLFSFLPFLLSLSHRPGRRVGIRRPSGGAVTVAGGGRAHHAHLAAAATRPEAPSASSPNDRGTRSAACIARDDLAEAARLVDRSRGEAPDAAVAAAVKTNASEVRESKHQAHTAAPVVRGVGARLRGHRPHPPPPGLPRRRRPRPRPQALLLQSRHRRQLLPPRRRR